MATRSFIALKHSDDTFSGVYCHWDGYPENNGKILRDEYVDRTKIVELIDGGQISSLKTEHDWNCNPMPAGVLYYTDRGDEHEVHHFQSAVDVEDAARDMGCEYLYVYDESKWVCEDLNNTDFVSLAAVV